MRRLAFVIFAFVFAFAFALLPGCGGGDDDNPAGPGDNDTLATEQVLQEIEDVLGSVQSAYQGCDPAYVAAGLLSDENLAELGFLVVVIDSAMNNAGDLSPFYGTWQDTTPLQPFDDPVRIDEDPAGAVALRLVGQDTLGTEVPGELVLREFFADDESGEILLDASIHADGSTDSLWVRVDGTISQGLEAATVEVWAHVCGADAYVDAEIGLGEGGAEATIAGWYEYTGDPKLYFEVAGSADTSDIEGSVAGTLHLWTTEDPEFDLTIAMVNDPDTCLTGELEIDGRKEADIFMVDCDDEEAAALYIVIDGQTFDGEELLGEIYDILISLDPDDLPGMIETVPSKGIVPPILWPMGKSHAEALERYRK